MLPEAEQFHFSLTMSRKTPVNQQRRPESYTTRTAPITSYSIEISLAT